jgi:hypothetical protein
MKRTGTAKVQQSKNLCKVSRVMTFVNELMFSPVCEFDVRERLDDGPNGALLEKLDSGVSQLAGPEKLICAPFCWSHQGEGKDASSLSGVG